MRDEKGRSQTEVAQARKDLEDEVAKTRQYIQQVDRLKSVIESLDQTKEELMRRLQNTQQEKVSEEQGKAVLIGDVQSYKREILLKEQEIVDLRKSVEQLDASMDELQQELDTKTEELALCRQQLDKQARDFSNVQH